MNYLIPHLLIGFIFSALMARYFDHDDWENIYLNFMVWELVIVFRTIIMAWRLLAGQKSQYNRKWHYIWTR